MKILLCTNSFDNITNGPAKFANLILKINSLYNDVEIRILTEDTFNNKNHVYKLEVNIKSWLKPFSQLLRMYLYDKEAEKIHGEYPFDILIYNNSFIGLLSAKKRKFKTIGMINDDNNLDSTFYHLFKNRIFVKRIIFKFFEKLSAKHHHLIISNSDYLTKKIVENYNIPSQKVCRLYKSIDTSDILVKKNLEINKNLIKILFVKNDYMRGGLAVLKDAIKKLDEYSFYLTIAGPEFRFKKHILNFFEGIKNVRINFVGPQPQKEIYKLYIFNDIFCVPSLKEALGVANIEALASGITVISSNAGGIPEVIDENKYGWVSKSGDPESLAMTIKTVLNNDKLRIEKQINSLSVAKKFSSYSMFDKFIKINKSLLR